MLDATPAFRLLAARRARALAALSPEAAQLGVLQGLLARAAETRFGRAHGFAAIRNRADYVRAMPLRTWQQFWDEWWRPDFPRLADVSWPGRIPFFAETSGTTGGVTKHIPVSHAMLRSNRRAALDLVQAHLGRDPGSRFFAGPGLILGGSTALTRLAPGVASGDLSGIVASTMPAWTHGRALPSAAAALTADWERKLERVVDEARAADLRSISGTTSWLLVLFERLLAASGAATLADMFPHLELVIHGGVGFAPYRRRFTALLGDGPRPLEVYPASEGFIGYQDGAETDGLRVPLDNGIFFEFVRPEELDAPAPRRFWVGDVAPGVDHALVLTTNAGLFSYVLGDLVRVVSRVPFRLVVAGRIAHGLSAFGEHLSGGELDRAIELAAREAGLHVTDYTVGVLMPDDTDPRGGHLFAVECADAAPDDASGRRFAAVLDATLAAGNADYAAHRAGGTGMRPPALRLLPPGSFARWMRERGRLGGQNKVPRVITDTTLLARLLEP